ncbi:class I SAM-dependent methyltransferase [Propioniciclava coleopterorum]|uniref:Class I SAM-dependent methyltransferase n=2 Tax=Propioniciclava coleopterorum TaxID=2714937 RepID=A0A6G7YBA1_9ACTN|nr:class I SAM-dependent methyltransferase [Propioniciclava coleopterorum]
MIAEFCAGVPAPRTVLDAGCGTGRMFPTLAAAGLAVTGLDASAGMLDRARRDHPDVPLVRGSLTDLPFPDASFAGVFAWYSTIHLPDADLPGALAELVRVTAPGGAILLGFQAGAGMRDVGGAFAPLGFDVTLPRWHRSPDALADGLAAAGAREVARMVRAPRGREADAQAVLLAGLPTRTVRCIDTRPAAAG